MSSGSCTVDAPRANVTVTSLPVVGAVGTNVSVSIESGASPVLLIVNDVFLRSSNRNVDRSTVGIDAANLIPSPLPVSVIDAFVAVPGAGPHIPLNAIDAVTLSAPLAGVHRTISGLSAPAATVAGNGVSSSYVPDGLSNVVDTIVTSTPPELSRCSVMVTGTPCTTLPNDIDG